MPRILIGIVGTLSDKTPKAFELKNGVTVVLFTVGVFDKAYAAITFAIVLLKSSTAEMLA